MQLSGDIESTVNAIDTTDSAFSGKTLDSVVEMVSKEILPAFTSIERSGLIYS